MKRTILLVAAMLLGAVLAAPAAAEQGYPTCTVTRSDGRLMFLFAGNGTVEACSALWADYTATAPPGVQWYMRDTTYDRYPASGQFRLDLQCTVLNDSGGAVSIWYSASYFAAWGPGVCDFPDLDAYGYLRALPRP